MSNKRGRKVGQWRLAYCANMRRKRRPNQRPLSKNDALQKLMRRAIQFAGADADLLQDAVTELLTAKVEARNAIDALHRVTETFIYRLRNMRHSAAWINEPDSDKNPTLLQLSVEACGISSERVKQAIYDKLHKQTLDQVLRRPGYICAACGHSHT